MKNSSSLILSKKSSVQSNFKMDFIDPGRNGMGMLGGRNSEKIVNLMPHTLAGARTSR